MSTPKKGVTTERQQELNDLRYLLESEQGKRVLRRVLAKAGIFRTSFTGNSTTFFREGERNIGLWLIAELEDADADKFTEVLRGITS